MSHYTVMLVTEKKPTEWSIQEHMAPYCEQTEDSDFLEFEDCTEEVRKAFESQTEERVKTGDGEFKSVYDEEWIRPATDEEKALIDRDEYEGRACPSMFGEEGYRVYDYQGNPVVSVPVSELYDDIQAFTEIRYGYSVESDGRIGYMTNPDAKWDWYQIGGRWAGMWKPLKDEDTGTGSPGVFGNIPETGYVDIIRRDNVDEAGMEEDRRIEAEEHFSKYAGIVGKHGDIVPLEILKEKLDGADALKAYQDQKVVKALKDAGVHCPWTSTYEEYYCSGDLDKFIRTRISNASRPYAVLDTVQDKGWFSQGDMGWFGISFDEDPEYADVFDRYFRDIPGTCWLTSLDCHI